MKDPLLASMVRNLGLKRPPLEDTETPRLRKYRKMWNKLALDRDGPISPAWKEVMDKRRMSDQVKAYARSLGADMTGICELRPHFIDEGKELNHRYVVAVLVHEQYGKVLESSDAVHEEAFRVYAKVAEIATEVARYIRGLGYPALAHHNGASELIAIPILHQVGFGELGRHGSLITELYGASFRPSMVTTDLPMEIDLPVEFGVQNFCLLCRACMNNCPGGAIPKDYILTEGVRRWVTDVEKCYPYSRLRKDYCHICVDVCPFNSKHNKPIYMQFMKKRLAEGSKFRE